MRVLVVGGTGFLGPSVVGELVARGSEVTIVHSGEHEADLPASVDHLHVERSRLHEATARIDTFGPEVLLDMAPMVEAHAAATMELARAAQARRVVAISSSDVYRAYGRIHGTEPGPADPVPIREDAPLRERLYPYRGGGGEWAADYDKIPIERQVLDDDAVAGTVLRLALVHGPRSYRYYEYVRRIHDGRPAIPVAAGVGGWRATRAYADDVAHAVALAVLEPAASGRVYNVGEPDGLSEADLIRALAEAAGWRGSVVTVDDEERVPAALRERLPTWMWQRWKDPQDLVLDTGRVRRELGYRERTVPAEGLSRTVEWLRAHPPAGEHPVIRGGVDYVAEDELLAALR